jgi:aspartate racemase
MHKKIGIIGGMSPESTIEYYRYITRTYTQRFGDYGYPEILIDSVSFQPYVDWPKSDRWDLIAEGLATVACRLENAGADFLVIATNTMHLVFDEIQTRVNIPIISIMDAVGSAIQKDGLQNIAMLGTRFTMEKSFYASGLARYGIRTIVPSEDDRLTINRIIYDELVNGTILDSSRDIFHRIIGELYQSGAQGMILGCTEIPLLVNEESVQAATGVHIPLYDSTFIHAEAALQFAIHVDKK